jgi:hypothetical protein
MKSSILTKASLLIMMASCSVSQTSTSANSAKSHNRNYSSQNQSSDPSAVASASSTTVSPSSGGTSTTASMQTTANNWTGIYVAGPYVNNPYPDYVFSSPYVTGIAIRLPWKYFEPQPGKYDWSFLDSEMGRAVSANKKISLAIWAGGGAPDWLQSQNIPGFNIHTEGGNGGEGHDFFIPLVWNPTYINVWCQFVAALSQHLQSNSAVWNALTQVKITGINVLSEETRLPAELQGGNNRSNAVGSTDNWVKNGYHPLLVAKAFFQIADTFAKYFPDKILSIPIIAGNRGFPPIDDNGNSVSQAEDLVTPRLISYMNQKYGMRFMAMYTALTDKDEYPDLVSLAGKGSIIGYQFMQKQYDKPECMRTGNCDNSVLYNVFKNGMHQKSVYFEIFPADVKAYPEALHEAQTDIANAGAK